MCPSLYWSALLILLVEHTILQSTAAGHAGKSPPSLMRHARALLDDFILLLTVHLIVHGYVVLQSQTTLPTAEGIYRRNSLSASLGVAMLNIRVCLLSCTRWCLANCFPKCVEYHSQVVMHASSPGCPRTSLALDTVTPLRLCVWRSDYYWGLGQLLSEGSYYLLWWSRASLERPD